MSLSIAAIVGTIFAAANMADYGINFSTRKEKLQNDIDSLNAKKDRELALSQLQFETDQKNAYKKADQADKATTLAEAMFGRNASIALNNIGMNQEAKTLQYNQQAIQSGAGEGSAYNAIGASGTRNSSAKQAIAMQASFSDKQQQLQQDLDRKQDSLTLASAMNNFMEGANNLQTRRTEANDLRDSFSEGGDVYNLYQKKRENFIADVGAETSKLEDAQKWTWNDTVNLLTAGLAGAKTGYDVGTNIEEWQMNWKAPSIKQGTQIDTNTISFDNLGTGYNNQMLYLG